VSSGPGSVIKSSDAGQINPLFAGGKRSVPQGAARASDAAALNEINRLKQSAEAYETLVVSHEAALKQAYDEGHSAGYNTAELDIEDSRKNALERLSAGIEIANADLHTSLARFENYALQAAAQALETLIDAPDLYTQIIGGMITRQVEELGKATIITITVSRSDFPDSRELMEIAPILSDVETKIALSDELPAGRCDIKLMVGTAEIDFRRTWQEILAVLADTQSVFQ
jgi:flagellar biosynthesis/type III secretory pathway protein FliH